MRGLVQDGDADLLAQLLEVRALALQILLVEVHGVDHGDLVGHVRLVGQRHAGEQAEQSRVVALLDQVGIGQVLDQDRHVLQTGQHLGRQLLHRLLGHLLELRGRHVPRRRRGQLVEPSGVEPGADHGVAVVAPLVQHAEPVMRVGLRRILVVAARKQRPRADAIEVEPAAPRVSSNG